MVILQLSPAQSVLFKVMVSAADGTLAVDQLPASLYKPFPVAPVQVRAALNASAVTVSVTPSVTPLNSNIRW